MNGLLSFFPIYLNGLLAIFFVFVLPGAVLVHAVNIPSFPQRWLVVFLSSLMANHLLVTLIAQLHLNPLGTFRAVTAALIVVLTVLIARKARTKALAGGSIMRESDAIWLIGSLVVLCFAYFNVWKHGVPNIFQGGDVSVSWNRWAMICCSRSVVSQRPAATHWATAASQPAREKMKVMAGRRSCRSRLAITCGRLAFRTGLRWALCGSSR